MTESFRITGRPHGPSEGPSPQRQVTAAPTAGAGGSAPGSSLKGLLDGLSSFNPALNSHLNRTMDDNARQAALDQAEAIRQAQLAGKAAGVQAEGPVNALTGQPVGIPASVPQAYGRDFRDAFNESVSQRAGVEIKQAALSEYNQTSQLPGFDRDKWLGEQRQKALQGVTDPRMIVTVGAHMNELDAEVRADSERARRIQQDATRVQTASVMSADMFTANMRPDELQGNAAIFQQRAKDLGFDSKQSAGMIFSQVREQSAKAGGMPEMFDVFERKDEATGLRLIDMNPELATHIASAKHHAIETRDKAIKAGAQKGNGVIRDGILKDIDKNPYAVTSDRLLALMGGPGATVHSADDYAGLMNQARDAQMKLEAKQQLDGNFDNGTMFRLEAGLQNKIMDGRLGPAMDALVAANKSGDPAAVASAAALMMQAHSRSGATIPWDQLKGFVSTNVTNLPSAAGASTGFKSAVEVFKAMSGNAQYRDLYFTEDVQKVMKGYASAVASGTDEKTAYTQAYQAISPEAKKASDDFAKTPEFKKIIEKDAKSAVEGTGWWPKMFGGNGRAENQGVVASAIGTELREWRARNPNASDDDAASFASSWTAKNFVLDTSSGVAVRVPAGLGGAAAQEAISAHSAELSKRLSLGDRSDAKWTVQYLPLGTEGQYQATAFNGMASHNLGPVSLKDLITTNTAKKVLTDEDRAALGVMRAGVATGNVQPVDPKLLAKAQALGVLKPEEVRVYRDQANKVFVERMTGIPKMSFGEPSAANLQSNPARSNVKVDNTATARAALELLTTPMVSQHMTYTSSLTAMREAMMLKAYPDPNPAAGSNIGFGYNLKANAKTLTEDFKRAMIPVELHEAVKNGTAEITPDQAKRLLMVALPRYEKQVRETAEATSPGLWDKMLPQQKAVMVDIAYQVGSTDKFKATWAALVAGDEKGFAEHGKVMYRNKAGEMVEDKRAGGLRASMLAGQSHWDQTIQTYGKLPNSKLAATAGTPAT